MRIDSASRAILLHIFKKQTMNVSKLTDLEKTRCSSFLQKIGYSIEEFASSEYFSEDEQSQVIFRLIKEGIDASAISELLDWKKFEQIISHIFNELNFMVLTNFRFKDEVTRYEVDVIAFNYPYIFLIDCKYHKLISSSVLKEAVKKQKERTEVLVEVFPFLSDELIKKLQLPLKRKLYLFPIIISWRDHSLQFYQDVPIISYNQLTGFLNEIDEFRDNLFHLSI
ncbi:MAG: hypothetical protein ACXABJ_10990, partial [Candidatus Heimdallarchaeaceae archaeon]